MYDTFPRKYMYTRLWKNENIYIPEPYGGRGYINTQIKYEFLIERLIYNVLESLLIDYLSVFDADFCTRNSFISYREKRRRKMEKKYSFLEVEYDYPIGTF